MKDLVIGSVTGYNFDQISPWVNSLDRSGFDGHKVVLAYNMDAETARELSDRDYNVLAFQKDASGNLSYPDKDFAIVVDRFLHYYLLLDTPENTASIRYVIATDVKDVIFQSNPSDYITARCPPTSPNKLILSSEGITYQHEPWGANNLRLSFGDIMFERHKTNNIYNCGVLAGEFSTFMGLCKTIWLLSRGTVQHVPGGGGPDQAALNLLLSTAAYRNCTRFSNHTDGWAAQLGTMMDPGKLALYAPNHTELGPTFNTITQKIETTGGVPYAIVHQWDRVPEVKLAIKRSYGS